MVIKSLFFTLAVLVSTFFCRKSTTKSSEYVYLVYFSVGWHSAGRYTLFLRREEFKSNRVMEKEKSLEERFFETKDPFERARIIQKSKVYD
jgi:hypothetical protein